MNAAMEMQCWLKNVVNQMMKTERVGWRLLLNPYWEFLSEYSTANRQTPFLSVDYSCSVSVTEKMFFFSIMERFITLLSLHHSPSFPSLRIHYRPLKANFRDKLITLQLSCWLIGRKAFMAGKPKWTTERRKKTLGCSFFLSYILSCLSCRVFCLPLTRFFISFFLAERGMVWKES